MGPSLALDPDGNVQVAWQDVSNYLGSDTDDDIFYKAKMAGSWTVTEVVSTESTDNSKQPSLAVDPDGNVHVAWRDHTDYVEADTDWDIFYKAKAAGSWTTPEQVSTQNMMDCFSPSLAPDQDGNAHMAWNDNMPEYVYYRMMLPIASSELKASIDTLEDKIDDIEAKLDDPNSGLIPIKSEVDNIEGKLDILLERLGIVGGLMLPTDGLRLVIDLFVNNAAAMILGILLLVGLPLLMRRIKKKG